MSELLIACVVVALCLVPVAMFALGALVHSLENRIQQWWNYRQYTRSVQREADNKHTGRSA